MAAKQADGLVKITLLVSVALLVLCLAIRQMPWLLPLAAAMADAMAGALAYSLFGAWVVGLKQKNSLAWY